MDKKYVIYEDVNAMSKSEEILESEPQIQYEIKKESKRHGIGFYVDLVKEFLASNKPIWTYPVPKGMFGGSYLTNFRRATYVLGVTDNVFAHGCKVDDADAIVLRRLDIDIKDGIVLDEAFLSEGRPPTQHEINSTSLRHRHYYYRDIVKEFYNSKQPVFTYIIPQGVYESTCAIGFRNAVFALHLRDEISVHVRRTDSDSTVILRRENISSALRLPGHRYSKRTP